MAPHLEVPRLAFGHCHSDFQVLTLAGSTVTKAAPVEAGQLIYTPPLLRSGVSLRRVFVATH